jgi:hypothetical protein
VKNKTIDLLEKVIAEINFGHYEYDDKLLYNKCSNLHKSGLLDKTVVPLRYGSRESLWDYVKVVIGSTATLAAGCSVGGPVGCIASLVLVGIDVYEFACEVNGCQ